VIGKKDMATRQHENEAGRLWPSAAAGAGPSSFSPSRLPNALGSYGFTLLELMIVISIIIILAVVVLPQYNKTITHARETTLRDDLFEMRKMVDQYAADKGKLPQSLDDLVSAGYIREVPVDPFTDQKDWNVTTGDDPNSAEGGQGITDVHSASTETSTEGTPYSSW